MWNSDRIDSWTESVPLVPPTPYLTKLLPRSGASLPQLVAPGSPGGDSGGEAPPLDTAAGLQMAAAVVHSLQNRLSAGGAGGGGAPPGVPLMHAASDLQGDEALSLFADNSPYSHPDEGSRGSGHPYPVGAAGHATLAASAGSPQPMETTAEG